jgi:hypothetical protein
MLELQVPPLTVLDNVVVCPWHKFVVPEIVDGRGLTVMLVIAVHPVDNV